MKVLVCGGRDFKGKDLVYGTLNGLCDECDVDLIIQGGAAGADWWAKKWAQETGTPEIEMKPNWDYFGKVAGPLRNEWMLRFCNPDLVLAFPGGAGTADMVKQAHEAGIEVREIDASGG